MIRFFLKRLLAKHRNLFFQEAQRMTGFLALLMKQRNSDEKWTPEEKRQIKSHLKVLAMYIPALFIFFLPGGSLLLPFLAEVMDRRKARRLAASRGDPKGLPEEEDQGPPGRASRPSA